MKFKIFILFLIACLNLHGNDIYPTFSKKELHDIAKKDKISFNRINDYIKTIKNLQNADKQTKLYKINLYLNKLLSQYDTVTKKQQDYWATPKEFLIKGYGDCEDYAIIKYYSLIKLGFEKNKLFLTIVKEHFHGHYHMVLIYVDKKNLIVLDNLSFRILPLKKRTDLKPIYLINDNGVYVLTKKHTIKKIAHKYVDFETVKNKVKKNM